MSKIKKFEEIKAWKEARELTNDIYSITSRGVFSKDIGLKDQIQRASISTMANIAEGFGNESHREFLKFLYYSRRSLLEVQSHLYVALDMKYINKKEFNQLYVKSIKVKKLLGGFIRYLKR